MSVVECHDRRARTLYSHGSRNRSPSVDAGPRLSTFRLSRRNTPDPIDWHPRTSRSSWRGRRSAVGGGVGRGPSAPPSRGTGKAAIARRLGIGRNTVDRLLAGRLGIGRNPVERLLAPARATAVSPRSGRLAARPVGRADRRAPGGRPDRTRDRHPRTAPADGYRGGSTILKEHLAKVLPAFLAALAYQRTSYRPGEIGQVDWRHTGAQAGDERDPARSFAACRSARRSARSSRSWCARSENRMPIS